MKQAFQILVALSVLIFALGASAQEFEYLPLEREWTGERLVSHEEPAAEYLVDPSFEYLGGHAFNLYGVARAERHYWIESGSDDPAMLVLQFERYLDDIDGSYSFSIPPAEGQSGGNYLFSPERVMVGSNDYVHNTWAFNTAPSPDDRPGNEAEHTRAILAEHGLEIPEEVIMSRAVRRASDDGRAEIILFYLQPLGPTGHTLSEFIEEEPVSDAFRALSESITTRHFEVLTIVD